MTRSPMASRHRWIYLGSIALLVAMLITGLLSFTQLHATDLAARKADQLSAALSSAGYPVPTRDQIVHTLGEDGGAVCADPANALNQAQWTYGMSNGAGGPGQRPVLSDREVVRAEAIVLSVYCPDRLAALQDRIDDLDLRDTVRK
ncbi:hypothetical protein [Streptomyces sp. CBMA123]|uniref:hypothetical protein n=1 Tax=Streptomyces sp. CBMA123 TaxID=1896313 RepID=UPI0016619B2F|nr:hypothetical protein [Streptomyces sp. CBMA123]MBD0688551.1 hypothetical protein [Streptomyces sp. CBMA123]